MKHWLVCSSSSAGSRHQTTHCTESYPGADLWQGGPPGRWSHPGVCPRKHFKLSHLFSTSACWIVESWIPLMKRLDRFACSNLHLSLQFWIRTFHFWHHNADWVFRHLSTLWFWKGCSGWRSWDGRTKEQPKEFSSWLPTFADFPLDSAFHISLVLHLRVKFENIIADVNPE